jgi:hypothetical protein
MSTTIYHLPQQYLNGGKSPMAFWHVVYYLLARGRTVSVQTGRAVETNLPQLLALTGISVRQLTTERHNLYRAKAPYQVLEEDTVGGFVWRAMGYDTAVAKHIIQAPQTFVQNGWVAWLHNQKSRLPLAIINQLLRQPMGKRTLPLSKLRQFCQHPDRVTPPSLADMEAGVQFLHQHGIIELTYTAEGEKLCTLQISRWQEQAPSSAAIGLTEPAPSVTDLPIFPELNAQDPSRTARAILCAEAGNFAPETHLAEIWRDLAYVDWGVEETALLKKLRRADHKNEPPSPDRWRKFWQAYWNLRK